MGDDKIVGGTQVLDERKYPHQVSIDSGTRQCGGIIYFAIKIEFDMKIHLKWCFSGSLISDDAILTTATCLEIGDLFLITAGDIDKDVITGKEQTRNATRATVIIHPDFNPDLFIGRGNVAIIYLPIPFILNGIRFFKEGHTLVFLLTTTYWTKLIYCRICEYNSYWSRKYNP